MFWGHGTRDEVLRADLQDEGVEILQGAGFEVTAKKPDRKQSGCVYFVLLSLWKEEHFWLHKEIRGGAWPHGAGNEGCARFLCSTLEVASQTSSHIRSRMEKRRQCPASC